jgi:hypothetical protein
MKIRKSTIKTGVFSLLMASFALTSKAQTTPSSSTSNSFSTIGAKQEFRLSAGPDAGIPLGGFSNAYDWNLGGSIQADIPVVRDLFITVNAGYNNFFVKKNQSKVPDKNLELIPVKAGLKYFPGGSFFYVQGEAGASFLANKTDLKADKSAAFVYAPQVGVLLKLAEKNYIDLGIRFEGTSSFYNSGNSNNFLGLRAAYAFGL